MIEGSVVSPIGGWPGTLYWITPEHPSMSPSARSRHVAVYDDNAGVMLVTCQRDDEALNSGESSDILPQVILLILGCPCLCIFLFQELKHYNT